MITRRGFLRRASAGAGAAAALAGNWGVIVRAAAPRVASHPAEAVAGDEDYWREIQQAFTLDRTMINLNNGGVSPSPRVVHEAYKRYLDISNQAPSYYMWQVVEPNIEAVRRQLAREFGCDPEELAITRNASEALQAAQLGLDLKPGDEVVTTNQDYPRMLDTWEQRVRRDGIVLKKVSFPVPPPTQRDLADRLIGALSPRTKVLHFCHITNLTGQIFPVRDICRAAHERGIRTVVDGAHAFAHFPFKAADLECDVYGTSLHKWLLAPVGTGFLYIRRPLVKTIWPLTPANEKLTDDIRKFEEIGTHPGGRPQRHCRSAGVPPGRLAPSVKRLGSGFSKTDGPVAWSPDRARGSLPASILRSRVQSATCPSRGRTPPSSRHTSGAATASSSRQSNMRSSRASASLRTSTPR